MDKLGRLISGARERAGQSPKQLATRLKISESYVRWLEKKPYVHCSERILGIVARAYGFRGRALRELEAAAAARNIRSRAWFSSYLRKYNRKKSAKPRATKKRAA